MSSLRGMKTALITVGTRGDVQPYVVLGRELAARGHQVTLATHADYEAWVRAAGLGFARIGGSFKALVEWQQRSGNPRTSAPLTAQCTV